MQRCKGTKNCNNTTGKNSTTHITQYQIKSPGLNIFNQAKPLPTDISIDLLETVSPEILLPDLNFKAYETDMVPSNFCPMCVQFAKNGVTVEQITPLLHAVRRILAIIMDKNESTITGKDIMNPQTLIELSNVYNINKVPKKRINSPKRKFLWTDEFRKKADAIIYQLGVTKATPAQVVKLIQNEFPDLTRQNMESYLQKVRMRIRKGEELTPTLQVKEISKETEIS